jgi:hypothetical protein
MNIKQILDRGIEHKEFKDETYSYTGVRDFTEAKPEILTVGGKPAVNRPRTKVSKNNSYT